MTTNGVDLDTWRDYFRSSNSDIFSIIEHAIMVAAWDCPNDFRAKRDRIAEVLFTCRMSVKGDEEFKSSGGESKDYSKESKVVKSSSGDDEVINDQEDYDDDHEIEEDQSDNQIVEEVVRMKKVIDDESDSEAAVLESLRRLQLMPLSLENLKSTQIGKSVYALRKHGSKEIRDLARRLVVQWKRMVDNAMCVEQQQQQQVACSSLGDSMKNEAAPPPNIIINAGSCMKLQSNSNINVVKKPAVPQQQQEEMKSLKQYSSVDDEMKMRLEAAKRKLHQRYEEAENAKKRRMIQVVDPSDLPKQTHRQWPQGRW